MPNNLTDTEIKKALEDWRKELVADYQRLQILGAPMDCFEESHADTITKLTNALDLINRKDQENENLKAEVEKWQKNCDELYEQMSERLKAELKIERRLAKAEAYKECIEKVKEKAKAHTWLSNGEIKAYEYTISAEIFDDLLNELVGDENAERK